MDNLTIAIFLAVFVKTIVDAIIRPIIIKYPAIDFWWLVYVTWVLGGCLAWLAGVNLFSAYMPNDLVARILTAVVVGGGSNLIADLFGSATQTKWKYLKLPEPADDVPTPEV